jgi:UDP-2,3-diacylglucosamine pyrophosphatase LpxH
VWVTASGKRVYITHGDNFDGFVGVSRLLYTIGDVSYEWSMRINKVYNKIRGALGMEYWSISAFLKSRVKGVVGFLTQYRRAAEARLRETGCDVLMMGHTHTPEMTETFINTGDFCESCSFVVEARDGTLELRYAR